MTKKAIDLVFTALLGKKNININEYAYKLINSYVKKYDYESVIERLRYLLTNKLNIVAGLYDFKGNYKAKLTEEEYMKEDDKEYNELLYVKSFFGNEHTDIRKRQFIDELDIYNTLTFEEIYKWSKKLNQSISKLCERKGLVKGLLQW